MKIRKGEIVNLLKDDGTLNVRATVVGVDNNDIVLDTEKETKAINVSDRVTVSTLDTTYRAVVRMCDAKRVMVEVVAEDRRSYFRIDDSLPVKAKKVNKRPSASRFLSVLPARQNFGLPLDMDIKEDAIMSMLQEINQKLDYLINHLIIKQEGIPVDECQEVNLSASGMRVEIEEEVDIGDIVEIKMVLPSFPPVAIQTFGEVVRVHKIERDGKVLYEVGLKFAQMTEEVREEIIQYTLKRQREIIRIKREQL